MSVFKLQIPEIKVHTFPMFNMNYRATLCIKKSIKCQTLSLRHYFVFKLKIIISDISIDFASTALHLDRNRLLKLDLF